MPFKCDTSAGPGDMMRYVLARPRLLSLTPSARSHHTRPQPARTILGHWPPTLHAHPLSTIGSELPEDVTLAVEWVAARGTQAIRSERLQRVSTLTAIAKEVLPLSTRA